MQTNKKFLEMFIILVSLFIFIFFTRSFFGELIGNLDINEKNNSVYKEKIDEVNTLSRRQKELERAKEGGKKTIQYLEIKKYLIPFSEDRIINEIYSIAEKKINGKVNILSLTISEGVKNELGFIEAKLNISAVVKDKETMIDFLDYLIKDSKYKIFINSFNMPKTAGNVGYRIQIPATIFYVDSKNNK